MIYGDVVFGVISLIVSIWVFIMAQMFKSRTLSDGVPGAGFFPSIVCSILIVVSIIIIIQGIHQKKHYFSMVTRLKEIPANTKNLILTAVALLVFMLLWKYTFFLVAITALVFFLNALFKQKILTNIIYTVVIVTVIYLIFGKLFHVML